MKRIGILSGEENEFPQALVEKINSINPNEVLSEFIKIEKVINGEKPDYDVIIDRISHKVPFYQSYLKSLSLGGTVVINNPFILAREDKFSNDTIASMFGISVPKSVLIPSNFRPIGTSDVTFRNLAFPLKWDEIFGHINFPAVIKPINIGEDEIVHKINSREEFFNVYNGAGFYTLMLQEDLNFTTFYNCYCIDKNDTLIVKSESLLECSDETASDTDKKILTKIKQISIEIAKEFGYDFNLTKFGMKNNELFVVDFTNPFPVLNKSVLCEEDFNFIVSSFSDMVVKKAISKKEVTLNNLSWGSFMSKWSSGKKSTVKNPASKTVSKPKTKTIRKTKTEE